MYQPAHFVEQNLNRIETLVRAYPLAALVVHGGAGFEANHIPLEHVGGVRPGGTLRGHIARANALPQRIGAHERSLAIFQGPQGYVSPSWYPSKSEHGKVVPTWNYLVVHVHGPIRFVDDREWLRAAVTRLTDDHEARSGEGWRVTDAPAEFVDRMLAAIVGVEIAIERVEAKWKHSQNRPEPDRLAVAERLAGRGFSPSGR